MSFCGLPFLFKFLPISLALTYIAPPRLKNFVLLMISLFFYGWGQPAYVFVLLLVILLDYSTGIEIGAKKEDPRKAKRSFYFSIVINILFLAFLKYHGFVRGAVDSLLPFSLPYREISFPMGASFYILQAVSYLCDVYAGKVEPQKNLIHLALYVAMFPQMIAGPVVPYAEIAGQLKQRRMSPQKFGAGAERLIIGLSKRAILGNAMRVIFNEVIQMKEGSLSVLTAWVGAISFALLVYFDFSGYSDMASGLAKMFGFDFRRNFDYPYISRGISEFWSRWNISVITWFRAYVYLPLGGEGSENRASDVRRILLVWALIGMWHGSAFHFVIWGLYHGILLLVERFVFEERIRRLPPALRRFFAMALVLFGWVFFFCPGLMEAFRYLGEMFGIGAKGIIDETGLFLIFSNWLFYALAILNSSPAGLRLFRKMYLSCPSPRAQKIAAAAVYMGCFLVSLLFLSADFPDPFLQFGS